MRIAIYGNLIYDQIVRIGKPFKIGDSHNCDIDFVAGGIANFYRAGVNCGLNMSVVSKIGDDFYGQQLLNAFDDNSYIEITKSDTTFASVIVDQFSCVRTGMVRWGACRIVGGWKPLVSDWHHLMYLDRINLTTDELKSFNGIVSADFCDINEHQQFKQFYPYIDYLIVSETDVGKLANCDINTRRGIIVHSPDVVYYKIGGHYNEFAISKEANLNVVGAGDYFAAYAVANLLKNELPDLRHIHNQTLTAIKQQS